MKHEIERAMKDAFLRAVLARSEGERLIASGRPAGDPAVERAARRAEFWFDETLRLSGTLSRIIGRRAA